MKKQKSFKKQIKSFVRYARLQVRSFTAPDETRDFGKGKLDLVKIAGATIGLAVFQTRMELVQKRKAISKNKKLHGSTLPVSYCRNLESRHG